MPAATTDSKGNLYLAWDSYRDGNYDIFFRRVNADGTPAQWTGDEVPAFPGAPPLAIDGKAAYGSPGMNPGPTGAKTDADDPWRGVVLYADRSRAWPYGRTAPGVARGRSDGGDAPPL